LIRQIKAIYQSAIVPPMSSPVSYPDVSRHCLKSFTQMYCLCELA
jgi:hypothetical protein